MRVGLAYEEGERLRVPAPVREYVREAVEPEEKDLAQAMEHYGELARTLGPKAGREGGKEAIARLAPETANADAMIREGLKGSAALRWIDTAVALTDFARFSERSSPSPLGAAREAARALGDLPREAECLFNLGIIAQVRADLEEARRRYDEALPLYRRVGAVQGEANCMLRLGGIALARSDYEEAHRRFDEALPLYRRVGDVRGEANCILDLGEIALARSDHEEARRRYDEAMPLNRRVGAVQGEANCIESLGDIARDRSDHEEARRRYDAALPLYRRVGAVLGEANCIQSLGDIAWERSDPTTAKECYVAALALYARIHDSHSMGAAHRRLAQVATDPAEKQHHLATARALWTQIDRPDIIADYLDAS